MKKFYAAISFIVISLTSASQADFTLATGGANIFSTVAPASYLSGLDGGGFSEYSFAIDLNTDGKADMVTIDRTAFTQRVWLNNGSGFTEVTSAGAGNPLNGITLFNYGTQPNKAATQIIVRDFDSDGDMDIFDSYTGNYYINNGTSFTLATAGANIFATLVAGSYISSLDGGGFSEYMFSADLNADGLPDMVTIDRTTFAQRVWLNTGSNFTEVTGAGAGNPLNGILLFDYPSQTNKVATHLIARDFDHDGDEDIIDGYTGNYYISSGSSYTLATGSANIFSTVVPASYISSVSGGQFTEYFLSLDLNTDGLPDMVTIDRTTFTQRVWRNNGSGFTEITSAGAANPLDGIIILNPPTQNNKVATQLLAADFDGDGDQDIFDSYSGNYYIQQVAPPSLLTSVPADNAIVTDPDLTLTLNFNETISSAGNGLIELRRSSDNQLLESVAGNAAGVVISGTQVTVPFNTTLIANENYYIQIDTRAFFDVSGMTYQGINNETTFNFTASSTLPLNLLSFNGNLENDKAILTWTTANEIDTKEMIVERSSDGNNFTTVGKVTAKGSGDNSYQFIEELSNKNQIVYYRLKLVDQDETFTYSKVIRLQVTLTTTGELQVYPNPAINSIYLNPPSAQLSKGDVKIFNQQGQLVQKQFWSAPNHINISGLAAGMYFIEISDGTNRYSKSFIKR